MYRVLIPCYDGVLTSSVSLPVELLHATDDLLRRGASRQTLGVRLTSPSGQSSLQSAGGIQLGPLEPLAGSGGADLVVLPTRWRHPDRDFSGKAFLLRWLQQQHREGATLCAVGSGNFLLAEAGLLDGRPATTHWQYRRRFKKRFPRVELQDDYLLTEADRIVCAGSVNAVADALVWLIGQRFGLEIASAVESQFSPEVRRGFDQRVYRRSGRGHSDEAIAQCQEHIQRHIDAALENSALARISDLPLRSFCRRFQKATGETPQHYVQRLRLQRARELLRESDLSAADIAAMTGFSDPSHFGKRFREAFGHAPAAYRGMTRKKMFSSTQ